jgi:cytochrome c5
MKNGFSKRLLMVLALTIINSAATATQGPASDEQSAPAALPGPGQGRAESGSSPDAPPAESRGELLYENNCQGCHTSVVHVRETRRAHSLKDLEYWVKRWSGELKLQWSAEEISDVVGYLNRRYYKIESPSMQSP